MKFSLKKKDKINAFTDFTIGKYVIDMYRKINTNYVRFDTVKIDIKSNKFRYGNKDFIFNISDVAFSDKDANHYAFDYDDASRLKFNKKEFPEKISVDDVDRYVNSGIIAQIIKGLEKPKENKYGMIIYFVLGAVVGGAICFFIGTQVTSSKTVYLPAPSPTPNSPVVGFLYGLNAIIGVI